MWEFIDPILNIALPVILLLVGFFVGRLIERRHFRSLDEREVILKELPISDMKTLPPGVSDAANAVMVTGSVVVGADYFKAFAAGLRKLVGGEVRSFDRMMERARREAILRLAEEARRLNAVAVVNVRIDTAAIGAMSRNPSPMSEVIASGTAILPAGHGVDPTMYSQHLAGVR